MSQAQAVFASEVVMLLKNLRLPSDCKPVVFQRGGSGLLVLVGSL